MLYVVSQFNGPTLNSLERKQLNSIQPPTCMKPNKKHFYKQILSVLSNVKLVKYSKNLSASCSLSLPTPASRAWGHQTIMDFLPVRCSMLNSDVI